MKRIYVAGSINMDLVIKSNVFPVKGMTVMGEGFMTNPGGKGANQAYALGKLGANVSMLGAIGNDEYGSKLINNLEVLQLEKIKQNQSQRLKSSARSGVIKKVFIVLYTLLSGL